MKVNRRELMRAAAIAVGAGALQASGAAVTCPTEGVEFEFTGLFAIQLWQRTAKKAGILLARGKMPHIPSFMARLDDVDVAASTAIDYQLVHAGGTAFLVWSLADRTMWVNDASASYDRDTATSLEFETSGDWRSFESFPNLARVIGSRNAYVTRPKLVASKILLTRGCAAGVVPELQVELDRRYRVCGDPDTSFRKFASQLRVVHPLVGGSRTLTLNLGLFGSGNYDTPQPIGRDFKTIVLKVPTGRTAKVTIMNVAAGHGSGGHFSRFFELLGKTNHPLQWKAHPTVGDPGTCSEGEVSGVGNESPYAGCIPPGFPQDL